MLCFIYHSPGKHGQITDALRFVDNQSLVLQEFVISEFCLHSHAYIKEQCTKLCSVVFTEHYKLLFYNICLNLFSVFVCFSEPYMQFREISCYVVNRINIIKVL